MLHNVVATRKSASGLALLCTIPTDDDENPRLEWIPISQITDDSEVWEEGDEGDLVIKSWLARERGLDDL